VDKPLQRPNIDAMLVDWDRHNLGAGQAERFPCRPIAGVFNGDGVAWPNQRARGQ
jgi:hypothetical protein